MTDLLRCGHESDGSFLADQTNRCHVCEGSLVRRIDELAERVVGELFSSPARRYEARSVVKLALLELAGEMQDREEAARKLTARALDLLEAEAPEGAACPIAS